MSMYQIVADSGSTKTDWVIMDSEGQIADRIKSVGFNPYFQTSEYIFNEILQAFSESKIENDDIAEVHYYGAGCSSPEKSATVKDALKLHFKNAVINVDHDLIAAARATLGDNDGIACIIGTGANSCVWKNGTLIDNIPSHGYIFGDEGSGSYLGIELLKLYLNDQLPEDMNKAFEKQFKLSKDQILNATYREKSPNVFLAHFASFYENFLDRQLLSDIIYFGFDQFFKIRVMPYENYGDYQLGFVGSIAFYYREILEKVAAKYGMNILKVTKCPIDNLVIHHLKESSINNLS